MGFSAEFIRQEINGCLDDLASEIDSPGYLALLETPFRRLSDEVVLEIINRVNRHCKRPKIKDFELAYDALHYFLIRGTYFYAQISTEFIQDNWAGCTRNHVARLNFLRKVGVLSPETPAFRKIPQARSMRMKEYRGFSLAEDWAEKIRVLRLKGKVEPIKPYGFQPHAKAIFRTLEPEGKALLLSIFPRDFGTKLRKNLPVKESTQLMDCGLNLFPYLLNARNGVKPYRLFSYGARER